jgi:hypothetical protein
LIGSSVKQLIDILPRKPGEKMKFSMFITENSMQVNLTPENDHEKRFMDILNATNGEVRIHKGISISESQGGYIRNYGETERSTAITILNPKPTRLTDE